MYPGSLQPSQRSAAAPLRPARGSHSRKLEPIRKWPRPIRRSRHHRWSSASASIQSDETAPGSVSLQHMPDCAVDFMNSSSGVVMVTAWLCPGNPPAPEDRSQHSPGINLVDLRPIAGAETAGEMKSRISGFGEPMPALQQFFCDYISTRKVFCDHLRPFVATFTTRK